MKLYFRTNKVDFGTLTITDKTSSGFKVAGSYTDYKDLVSEKGFSSKKHSASTWTDAKVEGATYDKTYTGLDASTKYDVRMYVKVNGEKQYSAAVEVTTEAEAEEA